jgi:hypothetical protein
MQDSFEVAYVQSGGPENHGSILMEDEFQPVPWVQLQEIPNLLGDGSLALASQGCVWQMFLLTGIKIPYFIVRSTEPRGKRFLEDSRC